MKEPLVIHNFVQTGEGFGVDMRVWLEEELDRLYAALCPDNPCVVNPFTNLRAGITVLQGQNTAQQLLIDDLIARVEILEGP